MSNKIISFRDQLLESTLDFLWQNWGHLGTQVAKRPDSRFYVDLEPLLLLTMLFGRNDPRLFNESLQWLCAHGSWVNVARLVHLQKEDQISDENVVWGLIQYLSDHGNKRKWKHFLPKKAIDLPREALFHLIKEDIFGDEIDSSFERWGILRSAFIPRGKAVPGDFWTECGISLKSRGLFGVNTRADVFTYLLLVGEGTASTISKRMGYGQRWVSEVLHEMTCSQTLEFVEKGNQKVFRLDHDRGFHSILGITAMDPQWFDWIVFASAISKLWKFLNNPKLLKADEQIAEMELSLYLRSNRNYWNDCGVYPSMEGRLISHTPCAAGWPSSLFAK